MLDILDLPESILDLMGNLFNFNTFATVYQFPRQVPQNRQGPHAPLRDHLPAVRGGEWPRSRSHLRRGLQDGCMLACTVTGG